MIEYRRACMQDMGELTDFINMVFSMIRVPHDFAAVLPKVYAGDAPQSEIHEIACEGGRICGVVGLLPFEWKMAGCSLACGYVGSVSVHPRVRGQGVMRELMCRQIDGARASGMDLVVLGGQRQRYEHYGFAACGSAMQYVISRKNVRHALADADSGRVAFKPLEQGSEEADAAFALYEKQPVTGARTKERFVTSLRSYWNEAWAILCEGRVAGYMMADRDGKTVYELVLADESLFGCVIKAWLEVKDIPLMNVVTTPYAVERNAFMAGLAEGSTIGTDEMLLCLRPDRVIEAVLRLKKRYMPLEDGAVNLGFGSFGTIRIEASGEAVSVCRTEEALDLALEDRQAHEFVFGHDRTVWRNEDMRMPRGWFPLHLHVKEADRF